MSAPPAAIVYSISNYVLFLSHVLLLLSNRAVRLLLVGTNSWEQRSGEERAMLATLPDDYIPTELDANVRRALMIAA